MNFNNFDDLEYLRDDMLAKELEFEEQERFYEMERNKRLPAIIKVVIPWKKEKEIQKNTQKPGNSTLNKQEI